MNRKYTKEILQEAINQCKTWTEVCKYFGLRYNGGNNDHLKKKAEIFGINYSHFLGQNWTKGKKLENRRKPLVEYLRYGSNVRGTFLKKKLLDEKIFERKCSNCDLDKWLDALIPLELDHVDGDNENNNLENLRLLCPNCHALTDTYCGKNVKNKITRGGTQIAKAR